MKKILAIIVVAMIAVSVQAMAATVTVTQGSVASAEGGGPFTLSLTGDLTLNGNKIANSGSVFTSFCIEFSEHIYLNSTYTAAINPDESAVTGGGGAVNGADRLSVGTAYLFSKHHADSFNKDTATAFQYALWYLEDEKSLTADQILNNTYLQEVINDLHMSLATIKATDAAVGQYDVYVLNLTSNGVKAQDQLIYAPVPDGGLTALLLGIGVGGLALLSRKLS
jgi:hypothetical protein